MQAASREAFAASRERLDAVCDELDGGALRGLSTELDFVARVLGREPVLRRALSDPARSDDDRAALADDVFARHLSNAAQQVLRGAVRVRWSSAADLADALELLAVQALLAAAEAADQLGDVEDELFRFGRIVEAAPELGAILGDPSEDTARRAALARDLLSDRAGDITAALAELAVAGLGGRGFEASLQRLIELTAARRDRQVAYVRTAVPLTAEQEQRLADELTRTYGKRISVLADVDPQLLGGAVVRVGDQLYDGSVARRLEQVRAALARA